jgi:hypothetical protein
MLSTLWTFIKSLSGRAWAVLAALVGIAVIVEEHKALESDGAKLLTAKTDAIDAGLAAKQADIQTTIAADTKAEKAAVAAPTPDLQTIANDLNNVGGK